MDNKTGQASTSQSYLLLKNASKDTIRAEIDYSILPRKTTK